VARLSNGEYVVAISSAKTPGGKLTENHAEGKIANYAKSKGARIEDVFTEREPCAQCSKDYLDGRDKIAGTLTGNGPKVWFLEKHFFSGEQRGARLVTERLKTEYPKVTTFQHVEPVDVSNG
jgi:hypothetical protein